MKKIFFIVLIISTILFSSCSTNQKSIKSKLSVYSSALQSSLEASIQSMQPFEFQKGVDEKLKVYWPLFNGDFSLFDRSSLDQGYGEGLNMVYKSSFNNGKLIWKYVLMDFNNDGQKDLFIELDPGEDASSALFTYFNGKIKVIYIDICELAIYYKPLEDGRFIQFDTTNGGNNVQIYNYDSNFNTNNFTQYYKQTDIYNSANNTGKYYQQIGNAKPTELSLCDWNKIQNNINALIIPDNQMKNCSDFN